MGIFSKALKIGKRIFFGRRPKRAAKAGKARRGGRRRRNAVYNRPLVVKKTVKYDRIVQACNQTSFGADTFELADIPEYASYIALYDKFKIQKVVITYRTLTNSSTIYQAPGQITTTGFVHSYIDTTDGVAPGSLADMMNDSTYKITNGTRNHTRIIYPKFMVNVGANVQGRSQSGWLNTKLVDNVTTNTVSHYGIKFAFEGGTGQSSAYTSMIFEPIYTYYVAFKDPK